MPTSRSRRRSPRALAGALLVALATRAGAQTVTLDFTTTNGGFTPAAGYNTWGYRSPAQGGQWFTLEPLSAAMQLLSPTFYATGGTTTITLTHFYNLASVIGSPELCRDAGLLRLSTNGGVLGASLAPTAGHLYDGTVWDKVANPDAGQPAFCGFVGVGAPITTTWSFAAAAGTPFQFAFEAAFDNASAGGAGSTWFLSQVQLGNASTTAGTTPGGTGPTVTAPEPGAWALVATGLLVVGVRRRSSGGVGRERS